MNGLVFSIWEGTTNVLSLDLLRALKKDQSWPLLINFMSAELIKIEGSDFKTKVELELQKLNKWATEIFKSTDNDLEAQARELAFRVANIVSAFSWLRSVKKGEGDLLGLFIKKHFI